MVSHFPSPTSTPSSSVSGRFHTENEGQPLSPKRSFAQLEGDPLSRIELKRRDVQHSRRADPLSASDLANRCGRGFQSTRSALHHTLVNPFPVPDLWLCHPEGSVSTGSCEMRRSGISDALVCSWPPCIPAPDTTGSPHSSPTGQQQASQHGPPYSPNERNPSRASFLETTSRADPSDSFPTKPTTTMTKLIQTTGWKSENVLQPIRSRPSSMPSVRRPPGELWRSSPGLAKANQEPVDTAPSLVYPPPGLLPHRPDLRRSSDPGLLPHGSMSLSLALGSQPLRVSEPTKAVPPIGAERSRVISITSFKPGIPGTRSHDPSKSPECFSPLSPAPQPKSKKEINSSQVTSPEKIQAVGGASLEKDVFERLLRQAVRNKYAPKIMSPLNPLRDATPAVGLSADPEYQLRLPSQWNNPSPRYSRCPLGRARAICDAYQSFDWNSTCMHCPECKRDTVCKRLLVCRYRQLQNRHLQGNRLLAFPSRGPNASAMHDNRTVLANHIREAHTYEMDEEEKSLWEEVAAVTGVGPMSFSRVGTPCAAAAHRRVADGGSNDGIHDDCPEIMGEGMFANESGTLFREVSVY